MPLWPPMCWAWWTLLCPKYGDMKPLRSQICLSSSRSTLECCKFVHHVGELEHELMWKKMLTCSINPACNVSPKQAILGNIACIALPLVTIPSNTTYQTKICLDPISSTISIQTLVSTIKIYHHMKWNSWCGNHNTALKIGNLWYFPTQH